MYASCNNSETTTVQVTDKSKHKQLYELKIISNCSIHYISISPCLITRSNHEIVLVDDVGAVDNGEVVSARTLAAEDQLFLVHVQGMWQRHQNRQLEHA